MTPELYTKVKLKVADEVMGLLEEHEEGIKQAIVRKIEATDEGRVKVPVSFGVTLCPMGDTCGVKIKIAYGEKTCDESECSVDTQECLPGLADSMARTAGPGGSVTISTNNKSVTIKGK